MNTTQDRPKGILSVLLQDYFHRAVFRPIVREEQWDRIDGRLERDIDVTLELLSSHRVKATFFTLGWVAERTPKLIHRIAREGHEIASSGFWARPISELSREQFREDVVRSKSALEACGVSRVLGYRCANGYIDTETRWALDILKEEGFLYDGSYRPPFLGWKPATFPLIVHKHDLQEGYIWEAPVSTSRIFGMRLPISGGAYLRQIPHRFMHRLFLKWIETEASPFVLYFHPWELSENQPMINAIGLKSRIAQYRNLGKLKEIIPKYLKHAKFAPVADFLKIPIDISSKSTYVEQGDAPITLPDTQRSKGKRPVSVVVPCFNELDSLSYLDVALKDLIAAALPEYEILPILVDDFSTDGTWDQMQRLFGEREDYTLVRHEKNCGISKAIETGMKSAGTEIVCSIDADCSYDPLELVKMIPQLSEGVDLVTASPYHPQGFVLMVPPWRLFLSKSLSRMYHLVLHHKLWTYTACFRVYRRSTVIQFENRYSDFRGIVELVARLDLAGRNIVEFPTTLQSRIFGLSKMKILKTILGHLVLLCWTSKKRISLLFSATSENRRLM